MNVDDQMLKAKTQILRELGFFSPFVAMMRGERFRKAETETEKLICPSASVDMRGYFRWNPDWFGKLRISEMKGVLKHEILHYALMHCGRGKSAGDQYLWNIAVDIKTNHILNNEYHNVQLPQEGIIPQGNTWKSPDGQFKVEDVHKKSTDEIYEELYRQSGQKKKDGDQDGEGQKGKQQGPSGGQGRNQGHGGFDIHIHHPEDAGEEALTEAEKQTVRRTVREQIADAITKAKQAGNLPAGMERMFSELLEPKIDWRVELNREIRKELITDFTYRRPARRSAGAGVFIPSVVREGASMVTAVDVSGSIGQREINEVMTEILGAVRQFPQLDLTVISHDTHVHSVNEFRAASDSDLMNIELKGGGGTSHREVVKWKEKHRPQASLLVCFTDGYSDINQLKQPSNYRILWVLTSHSCDPKAIKFGKVIKLEK